MRVDKPIRRQTTRRRDEPKRQNVRRMAFSPHVVWSSVVCRPSSSPCRLPQEATFPTPETIGGLSECLHIERAADCLRVGRASTSVKGCGQGLRTGGGPVRRVARTRGEGRRDDTPVWVRPAFRSGPSSGGRVLVVGRNRRRNTASAVLFGRRANGGAGRCLPQESLHSVTLRQQGTGGGGQFDNLCCGSGASGSTAGRFRRGDLSR